MSSPWSTVADSLVRVIDATATNGPQGIPSPHDIRSAPLVAALSRSSESELSRIAWLVMAALLNIIAPSPVSYTHLTLPTILTV